MKTYKIFLASSSELLADRREFSELINYLNNENIRLHRGAEFLQVKWEWVDESVAELRKQNDYNQLLKNCDLFVLLYWTKVGKYSEEEFEEAYERLKGTRRLFVYKKIAHPAYTPSKADNNSVSAFEQKLLNQKGHFRGEYETADGLKQKLQTELTRLFDDRILTYDEMPMAKCLSAGQPAVPEGFIGRRDELDTIRQRMDEGGTLMLINSEGGMGKTSIAAKYWKENLYRYTHNAWLFCENGIVGEIKKLAPALNLDLAQLPEDQHVTVLRTALQNLPADCLLVLDNANDPDDIKAFRQAFSGLHWHILITSRSQDVLDKQQELPIAHLPKDLARNLFVREYWEQTPEFESLLDQLLQAIGYNTLLIEIFAKNMAELAALGETLADFLKRVEKELFLRDWSFEVVTSYTTHIHKEAATTDAIIEALYDLTKLDETARFRLVNMSLLPAESHLLTTLVDLFASDDKITLRNQLASLAQKGWLTTDTKSYRLSPVVQKILLTKYQATLWEDGRDLVERLTDLLDIEDNKGNITTKFKWIRYTQLLQTYFDTSKEPAYSRFQNNLATVLGALDGEVNLRQAKTLLESALVNEIARFGESYPTVAKGRSNLALVLRGLGGEANLLQAKALLEKALVSNIANFGETDPTVTITQSNLALVLQNLGGETNLRQAKNLLQKVLKGDIINFGANSPAVANRQSNLSTVLTDLGGEKNLRQAKALLDKALASDIANFGDTAPVVAIRQSNLAAVLQGLGGERNLLQAKALLEKALTNDIASFGEAAPAIALRQSNLATVLGNLGGEFNLQQAKSLLEKALANDTVNFGETSPAATARQSTLALALRDLGGESNLQQAKDLLDRALANNIANYGENHPSIAESQSNLATVFYRLGGKINLRQAKVLMKKALVSAIANFGEDSPNVAQSLHNLATFSLESGEREAACQLWLQAYWILRNSFSEEYGHTQLVFHYLSKYCPECFEQE